MGCERRHPTEAGGWRGSRPALLIFLGWVATVYAVYYGRYFAGIISMWSQVIGQ